MNRKIAMIGSAVVAVTVFLFAVFILTDFKFGSYFVCMFLPLGFIMMTAGFQHECKEENKVAANVGLILSAVYTVLILLVYFSQTTTVRLEELNEQAVKVLDYQRGGLMFNYDLLGYGMMALSTFFTGLGFDAKDKEEKWLKWLLIVHGIFFPGCFIMPMTGVFLSMSDGSHGSGGGIALLFWCVYFIPIGVLAYRHFSGKKKNSV